MNISLLDTLHSLLKVNTSQFFNNNTTLKNILTEITNISITILGTLLLLIFLIVRSCLISLRLNNLANGLGMGNRARNI